MDERVRRLEDERIQFVDSSINQLAKMHAHFFRTQTNLNNSYYQATGNSHDGKDDSRVGKEEQ